jgi:hypothetical protein
MEFTNQEIRKALSTIRKAWDKETVFRISNDMPNPLMPTGHVREGHMSYAAFAIMYLIKTS